MLNQVLYKYVGISGLKKMLGGSIRFTQPGAFNDPFELLPEIVIHKDNKEVEMNISFDILSKRRIPAVGNIEHVSDNFISSDLTSRNIVKKLNNSIGILCLSKESNSILMWSHYADQYTGAVVEFYANNDFFNGQIEVEYCRKRPRKDFSSYLSEPTPLAELCTKSADWEYEQEVRIVRTLDECENTGELDTRGFQIFIKKFPQECIKMIRFGERTSIADQREIYSLVKDTAIGLSLSAIDNSGYEFRQEIIKFYGPNSMTMEPMVSPRTAHIFSHLETPLGDLARFMIENHPASELVNNVL